jgi:hypothetical protein
MDYLIAVLSSFFGLGAFPGNLIIPILSGK